MKTNSQKTSRLESTFMNIAKLVGTPGADSNGYPYGLNMFVEKMPSKLARDFSLPRFLEVITAARAQSSMPLSRRISFLPLSALPLQFSQSSSMAKKTFVMYISNLHKTQMESLFLARLWKWA